MFEFLENLSNKFHQERKLKDFLSDMCHTLRQRSPKHVLAHVDQHKAFLGSLADQILNKHY